MITFQPHTPSRYNFPDNQFDVVGYLPQFMDENDPRPAKEQIHDAYTHGGGWNPFKGFKLRADDSIKYPGDPP